MAEQKLYQIKVDVIGDQQLQKFQRSIEQMNRYARQSRTALNQMNSGLAIVARGLRTIAPLIASAFSVQAVRNIIDQVDALGDLADNLGLAVEGYQELQGIAIQAGISQEQFADAISTFVETTAEAAAGTGTLFGALEDYNLALTGPGGVIASTTDTNTKIEAFSDLLASVEDPAQKAALAIAAFGEQGVNLVDAFDDGSESLRQLRDEVRELGLVFDQDLVRSAQEYGRALDVIGLKAKVAFGSAIIGSMSLIAELWVRLKDRAQEYAGIGTDVVTSFNDLVTATSNIPEKFFKFVEAFGKFADYAAGGAFKILIESLFDLDLRISTLGKNILAFFEGPVLAIGDKISATFDTVFAIVLESFSETLDAVQKGIRETINSITQYLNELGESRFVPDFDFEPIEKNFIDLSGVINDFRDSAADSIQSADDRMKEFRSTLETIPSVLGDSWKPEPVNNYTGAVKQSNEATKETAKNITDTKTAIDSYKESLTATQKELDLYGVKLQAIDELVKAGTISEGIAAKAREELKASLKGYVTEIDAYRLSLVEQQEAVNQLYPKLLTLHNTYAQGAIDVNLYKKELEALLTQMRDSGVITLQQFEEAMIQNGLQMKKWQEAIVELGEQIKETFVNTVSESIGEMAVAFINGERSFSESISSMIRYLGELIVQMIAAKAAAEALNAVLGAIGGGGDSWYSDIPIIGPGIDFIGGLFGFAKGGTFPALGTNGFITNGPMKFAFPGGGTLTPAARGMLIGEAGREAVMPLKRTKSGRLGVESSGSGVSINIYNNSDSRVRMVNRSRVDGGRDIRFYISDAVRQEIRRGGYDRNLRAGFNLSRRGF